MRLTQSAHLVRGRKHAPWVRRTYTLLAPIYDRTFLRLPGYRQAAHDLVERLQVSTRDSALDVGCGTGLLTLPLAERAQRTAGLDLSPRMLQRLSGKASRRSLPVELYQGNTLELPFRSETFSVVTTAFMLLYLAPEEKTQALAEMHRVLEPGGRLGCLSSRGEIRSIFMSSQHAREMLEAAGFTGVQVEDCRDLFRLSIAYKDIT